MQPQQPDNIISSINSTVSSNLPASPQPLMSPSTLPSAVLDSPARSKSLIARLMVPVLGLVLLGAVAATGIVIWNDSGNAAALSVAHQFVADTNSGKSAQAYALTSSSVHKKMSSATFAATIHGLTTSNPKISGESLVKHHGSAVYTATELNLPPTVSGSTKGNFTLSLVRSGFNTWRINSITVQ